MPRTAKPQAGQSALDHLWPGETALLLPTLLGSHPELRGEAEALALRMITTVDPEAVGEALEFAFSGINQVAFPEPPEEATVAWCEAALAPFLEGLKRLLTMGLAEPALAQAEGMLLGLHDLKMQLPDDAATYCTDRGLHHVLETWAENRPAEADRPLLAWVGAVLPAWRDEVEPALAHLRVP